MCLAGDGGGNGRLKSRLGVPLAGEVPLEDRKGERKGEALNGDALYGDFGGNPLENGAPPVAVAFVSRIRVSAAVLRFSRVRVSTGLGFPSLRFASLADAGFFP